MTHLETISPPLAEPVLLAEFKDHLRLDGTEEDAALGAIIAAARTLVEDYLGAALVERQVRLWLDAFPSYTGGETWWQGVAEGALDALFGGEGAHALRLPIRPVSVISSINIHSENGSFTTWGSDNYYLKPGLRPMIGLKAGRRWPVPVKKLAGIEITLTAGFGPDWNHVPAGIRQALLMIAGYMYSERGEAGAEGAIKASGATSLLKPYMEHRL